MLDWTTSFLSDETIIKLGRKSVKHFLEAHSISADIATGILQIAVQAEKCPAIPAGHLTKTERQLP
jgi:hypothetical protein